MVGGGFDLPTPVNVHGRASDAYPAAAWYLFVAAAVADGSAGSAKGLVPDPNTTAARSTGRSDGWHLRAAVAGEGGGMDGGIAREQGGKTGEALERQRGEARAH